MNDDRQLARARCLRPPVIPRRRGFARVAALATQLAAIGCGSDPAAAAGPQGEGSSTGAVSTSGGLEPEPSAETTAGLDPDRQPADSSGGVDADPRRPPPGPPFEDVTDALGIVAPHRFVLGSFAAGVAWGDVDGDGWLDLYMTGGDGPGTLLHNDGNGGFSVSPLSAAVAEIPRSTGATFVDLDDDGWPELYVVCRGPNVLLRNEGGRALVDVSETSGIDDPGPGASASWADWDADGDLDLFVANTGLQPDALYRNDGDLSFTDVSAWLPEAGSWQSFAATFSDYDDDGDLDLYVVIDKHAGNQLWRNDGPGCAGWCFTDVGPALGADTALDGMGVAVGDVDEDGDLDFVYSDHGGQALLLNDVAGPTGAFVSLLGDEAGLGLPTTQPTWGIELLDYDGDGWLDVYAVASGHLGELVGNPLYRNLGDGSFEDVSVGSGADDLGPGFGLAVADYDHDGAVDLAVGNRGEGLRLFHNRRPRRPQEHFSTLVLRGAGPGGREAVGARLWLETTDGRVMVREVRLGSSLGAGSSSRQRFSLGEHGIARLTVRWPDGLVEQPTVPQLDRVVELHHPSR
ncbi:MAG: CRTAC1 family protein [Nannocystaceae bacterium]